MELIVHVSVQEAAANTFERTMKQKFDLTAADSVTVYPEELENILDEEERAEVVFLYVVATKRMAPQEIPGNVAALQHFFRQEALLGKVTSVEFEPDDEEALRLLTLGLLRYTNEAHHVPELLITTIDLSPIAEDTDEPMSETADAVPFFSRAKDMQAARIASLYALGQFALYHTLLRPEQVALPADLSWLRLLYGYYIGLCLLGEKFIATAETPSPVAWIQNILLPAWETWFTDQMTDKGGLVQEEESLSRLINAQAESASEIQALLASFPETRHISFDQGEFTCEGCSLKTRSVRVAYYHGVLTQTQINFSGRQDI